MDRTTNITVNSAFIITLAVFVIWQITGGDYYTKFEVVEEIQVAPDPDDPLTATGFYEDNKIKKTVVRDELRLGLLPTPNGLLDKHIISVTTLVLPVWAIAFIILWWQRRRLTVA